MNSVRREKKLITEAFELHQRVRSVLLNLRHVTPLHVKLIRLEEKSKNRLKRRKSKFSTGL